MLLKKNWMLTMVNRFLKYIFYWTWDKITFIVNAPDRINEFSKYQNAHDGFIYNLTDYWYKERFRGEWQKVLSHTKITLYQVNRVYLLQNPTYVPPLERTMKYYIENRFWSAFNFFELDTFNWSDEEYYNDILMNKTLSIYYVIPKEDKPFILLATLDKGVLEYLEQYDNIKVPLYKIRRRQIVYDEKENICIV